MPKGRKRTDADYDRETEEAAKRMNKYPEHLRSARNSKTWSDFLVNIGVKEEIVESKSGSVFWDKVRDRVQEREMPISYRQAAEHGADIETNYYRDTKGRITKTDTGKPVFIYRNMETGRFVSKESLQKA